MPNQPTGFTRSELDLIHATAEANGKAICICTAALSDDAFPPVPGGGPRPEVARILADLTRDTQRAPDAAGPRAAAGHADRAAAWVGGSGVRSAERSAGSAAAPAVAYDRDAYDLEASRRLDAVAVDQAVDDTGPEAIAADWPEASRG